MKNKLVRTAALLIMVLTVSFSSLSVTARKKDVGQMLFVNVRSIILHTESYTNSPSFEVPYRECVILEDMERVGNGGTWNNICYKGYHYYLWIPTGRNYFTGHHPEPEYKGNTKLQQTVMDISKKICEEYDTKYAHKQSTGEPDTDGKYGFDCSGFVSYVMNKTIQEYIPQYRLSTSIVSLYNATSLYDDETYGAFSTIEVCKDKIDYDKLEPGDVLFFNLATEEDGQKNKRGYNHCGIYIGNGEMVHSSHSFDGKIRVMPLTGIYSTNFVCAKRYIPEDLPEKPVEPEKTIWDTLYL